ncbi:sugar O-acetyltransferase [Lactobacillus selangorensis]
MLNELVDCPSQDAYIEVPTRMDYGHNLHLGKHFYADYGSIFLDVAPITIGDNVLLGPAVSVYTAGHPLDVPIRNEDLEYGYPITIGNNVWIGGNAVLCPGITIGDNTVIGAGSIVTKDIPANVVAAGNPARIIRPITADDTRYWQAQKQTYLQARDEG